MGAKGRSPSRGRWLRTRQGGVLALLFLGPWYVAACNADKETPLTTEPTVQRPQMLIVSGDQGYTTDADFDEGTLVNVNHSAPNNNQLQLNTLSGTFPFIWVALSQRCTIAKVNTLTGAILGEYRTVADLAGCSESSRTTVGPDGSVWVGHRGGGGVTHVGLIELNQCIDRNGDGNIQTSTAYGDVKPWTGGAPSPVASAQDECILHHVNTDALGFGESRHMSITATNQLWVGSYVSRRFVRINGNTGAVEGAVKTGFTCGGYGGLIDRNGVIWSANGGSSGLLRWDPNAPDAPGVNPRCVSVASYGLAIDGNGWVWVSDLAANVRKVSPDGNTILGPFTHGAPNSQGLAVDRNGDVWVSSSLFCSVNCTIGHLKNNGTFVGNVANPTGGGSTGIAVDAEGKIWSANRSSHTATRIDPAGGAIGADGVTRIGAVDLTVNFPSTAGRPVPFPYNYSDMTGAQLFTGTSPQGSWTMTQDGTAAGTEWGRIIWNTEAAGAVPAGSSITVEARAADTEAALGSQTYAAVLNATDFALTGRFIQVRVTLRAAPNGASPILSDIRIQAANASATPIIEIRPTQISVSLNTAVTVYLYSTSAFDATQIQLDETRLVVDGNRPGAPIAMRNGQRLATMRDWNGDGRTDYMLVFYSPELKTAGLTVASIGFMLEDATGAFQFQAIDPTPPVIRP